VAPVSSTLGIHTIPTRRVNRWVGLGVIADNVISIGRAMQKQAAP
jgi:hypothetical protein